MKKILIPTDFSDNSWNAIKYALQLFKDTSCKFYLLNTYTPVVYHVEYVLVNPTQFGPTDIARENSLKGLERIKARIQKEFKNPNHSFECISSFNTLIPEIKNNVDEKAIDIIIMGTKGATGAQEVLFGTYTVHTIKNAKCPVMAIPEHFDFVPPKEILFPTDYEINYQEEYLVPVTDIAHIFNSKINVLNVSYGRDLSDEQEHNKQKLEIYLKETQHLFHSVANQHIPDAIHNFQLQNNFNLLVMINNKHSFFENLFFKPVINQIGFHLNIPFLVIPSKRKK